MKLDTEARYAKSHEWARKDGTEFVVGISDHAQHSLGDIVFVDLNKVGTKLGKDEAFGVVESVKAASDLYMPLSGTIVAVNPALADKPELVNKDCYGDGWLIRIASTNPAEWEALLGAADYEAATQED
jgi:glycine cleavage system H protein